MIKFFFFFQKNREDRGARPSKHCLVPLARPRIDSYPYPPRFRCFIGVREVLDLIARRKLAVPGVGDVVVSRHSVERASRDTWAEP